MANKMNTRILFDISERIEKIVLNIHKLKQICYPKYELPISYLTIFSQSEQDYELLRIELSDFNINVYAYLVKET